MNINKKTAFAASFVLLLASIPQARALDLDWSGQFRTDYNFIHNYTLDGSDSGPNVDPRRPAPGSANHGYYIPGGGSNNASFESLFLRLKPKLVVNDNVYIKSEWWLGDPIYGFFGGGAPYTPDQRFFNSTQNRGSVITAQRYWAEVLTDIGTLQVGRAPLNWGLGVVWNSGDGMWDRYESTGDQVRLISKFGSFSVSPAFILYSTGNNLGGACNEAGTAGCAPIAGSGGVADYSLQLKYENPDEDFEGGLNFVRRIGGAAQDVYGLGTANPNDTTPNGFASPTIQPVGLNFNTYDIYAKKKIGKFTVAGEVPVVNGTLGSSSYSTWALAGEVNWKPNDTWEAQVNVGHAPGQPDSQSQGIADYKAFYFNPNYKLGLVMFNYNLFAMAGPNTLNNPNTPSSTLRSPYDNPISDANYLSFTPTFHTDRWNFHSTFVFAKANESASSGAAYFYNENDRMNVARGAGVGDQSDWLGWEMDYGASFQWDDSFQFGLDFGFFFPGAWWKYSNVAGIDNATSTVFATVAKVGIAF